MQEQEVASKQRCFYDFREQGREITFCSSICVWGEELQGREWDGLVLLPGRMCGVCRCLFTALVGLVHNFNIPHKAGGPIVVGGVEAGSRPSCTLTDLQYFRVASVKAGR